MNITIGIYKLVDLIFKKLKLEAWEYDRYFNIVTTLVYLGLITKYYKEPLENKDVEVCTTEMYTLNVGGEIYVGVDTNTLENEALGMYIKLGKQKTTVTVMHNLDKKKRFIINHTKDSDILALRNKYAAVFTSRIWSD